MEYSKLICFSSCRSSKDTPLPTPTHRYNAWANNRKSLGITPQSQEGRKEGVAGEEDDSGMPHDAEWEENQKVRVRGRSSAVPGRE